MNHCLLLLGAECSWRFDVVSWRGIHLTLGPQTFPVHVGWALALMKDYDLSLILIPRTLLIDKYTYLSVYSLLSLLEILLETDRLPNNTHALITNMYSRHSEEYSAGMNYMQYLKVFVTFWRYIIALWRSIQPISALINTRQQSYFDRAHIKSWICSWCPPCASPHTSFLRSLSSVALLTVNKGVTAESFSWAKGKMQGYLPGPRNVHYWQQQWDSQGCHRDGCLGRTQDDSKENTGRERLKVRLEQPAARYPAAEVQILPQTPSPFPASSWWMQTSLQEADGCRGLQLQGSVWWHGDSAGVLWAPRPPGIAAGPSAALLPARHPPLRQAIPEDGKRWVRLSLQPCTSTPDVRRQKGRFYILCCLSACCTFFAEIGCICLFVCTYSPTAYSWGDQRDGGAKSGQGHTDRRWLRWGYAPRPFWESSFCLVSALSFPASLKINEWEFYVPLLLFERCCSAVAGSGCWVQECW